MATKKSSRKSRKKEQSRRDKAVAKPAEVTPAEQPLPTDVQGQGEVEQVKKPAPRIPLRAKLAWAGTICVTLVVGAIGWWAVLSGPDESGQGPGTPSASVQKIESALGEGKSLGECANPAGAQQAMNPQSAGTQLQNVPVNTLQTPQSVENQIGQSGGMQAVQPAGCL